MKDEKNRPQKIFWKPVVALLSILAIFALTNFIVYKNVMQNIDDIIAENQRLSEKNDILKQQLGEFISLVDNETLKISKNIDALWKANSLRKEELSLLETRVVTAQEGVNISNYVHLRLLDHSEESAWEVANNLSVDPKTEDWEILIYEPVDVNIIQQDLAFTNLVAKVNALSFDVKDNENKINTTDTRINFLVEHQEESINKFIKEHSTWLTGMIIKLDD